MRPPAIPMPIGMVPQWPRVVTAVMLQLPSNLAELAGGAEPTIAEAADSTKAHIRLPIMGVPFGLLNRNRNRQSSIRVRRVCAIPGLIAIIVGVVPAAIPVRPIAVAQPVAVVAAVAMQVFSILRAQVGALPLLGARVLD